MNPLNEKPFLENLIFIVGAILFFLLLYTTNLLFSPFVVMISLIILFYPFRENSLVKNLLIVSLLFFSFWLFDTIQGILAPFIIALLLAYLLHPLVTKIEKKGIPRWLSSLFILLGSIGIFIVLMVILLPIIAVQFESILQTVNSVTQQFTQWVTNTEFIAMVEKFGISTEKLKDILTNTFAPKLEKIMTTLFEGIFGIVSELSTVLTGIVNMIMIPFLTFYMLKDFPLVKHRIKKLVPNKQRERSVLYYNYVDDILGRYIRGTTIIAFIDAILVTMALWLVGISYPLVIGIISGILFFVPYFGFITVLCLTAIVGSFSADAASLKIIIALISLGGIHIFENFVLSPKMIGDKIGLHPIVLILSLFIFSYFFGFIGLLIAIPASGSIIVIIKEWETRRKQQVSNNEL